MNSWIFYDIPNSLGLFYAYRLENSVHCWFIFTYLVYFLKKLLDTSIRYQLIIDLVGRVFTNGPEDLGSILGRVLPKT